MIDLRNNVVFYTTMALLALCMMFSLYALLYFVEPKTCNDFSSHREAQRFFDKDRIKHAQFDRDRDNLACE